MGDLLLDVSRNRQARSLIKSLGLPIPLPESLVRDRGPWTTTPLFDKAVLVGAADGAELLSTLAETLAPAGADPYVDGDAARLAPFAEVGETFGRPARRADAIGERTKVHALVFDATGAKTPESLRALYDFFHAKLGLLARSGRVVVLGRNDVTTPATAAASAALDGFVRSVAKEIGKLGATANLVVVEPGAEGRLPPVLRFVLSPRSAFVTAQPIHVTNRARRAGAEPSYVRPYEKKVALVTGAARGIGEATARLLAQEGAHVVCLDRPGDEAATSQLAREIGGTPLLVDMGAEGAPRAIADALRALGGVDLVVHNAGITRDKTLARMKPELWDQVLGVNLAAVLRTTEALEAGVLKDGGRIVCLSSIAGIAGNMGQTNYAASKAGIVGYVRAMAERLADRGITVNAIAPGFIETRLTAAIPFAIREAARRMSALAQGGQPEDVAQAIVFLGTAGAQGITGRTLRVCGGSLIGA